MIDLTNALLQRIAPPSRAGQRGETSSENGVAAAQGIGLAVLVGVTLYAVLLVGGYLLLLD